MRHALLIGSQTYGLRGVDYDLSLMTRSLGQLGFCPTSISGPGANRAGILLSLEALIERVAADDVAVVYYAGHGGRARNPAWSPGSSEPRYLRFIVPTDMGESAGEDFRGILDLEFSQLLTRLATKCADVAVLLDCCHAARMVRQSRRRSRALTEVWSLGVASHLERLRQDNGSAFFHERSHPRLVRLAAAGANQSAYEDPDENLGGFFTEALAEAFSLAGGAPISWGLLGRWVREQVLVMEPRQRPELEGPVDRPIFGNNPLPARSDPNCGAADADNLVFFYAGPEANQPSIRGGRLHGVAIGNRYAILDLDETQATRRIATATVTKVGGTVSRVALEGGEPRDGAAAQPLRLLFPKRLVALTADVPSGLRRWVDQSPLLEVAPLGERSPMAWIRKLPDGLVIVDESGDPLTYPTRRIAETGENLKRLAHALTVRELHSPAKEQVTDFRLTWGQVNHQGQASVLNSCHGVFHCGERIYVRVENLAAKTLFVNLYDIGVSRRITLLNTSARSGFELAPGEAWCYGYNRVHGLAGIRLAWPASVPPNRARLETIVVFISDGPVDLTALEGKGVGQRSGRNLSYLERYVAARCLGGHRARQSTEKTDVGYAVRHLDFDLFPETVQK